MSRSTFQNLAPALLGSDAVPNATMVLLINIVNILSNCVPVATLKWRLKTAFVTLAVPEQGSKLETKSWLYPGAWIFVVSHLFRDSDDP